MKKLLEDNFNTYETLQNKILVLTSWQIYEDQYLKPFKKDLFRLDAVADKLANIKLTAFTSTLRDLLSVVMSLEGQLRSAMFDHDPVKMIDNYLDVAGCRHAYDPCMRRISLPKDIFSVDSAGHYQVAPTADIKRLIATSFSDVVKVFAEDPSDPAWDNISETDGACELEKNHSRLSAKCY